MLLDKTLVDYRKQLNKRKRKKVNEIFMKSVLLEAI